MPKVSVILPVYNVSLYIKEAMESVIQQKNTDWELIAVNDASTDNSLTILLDYQKKDKRIKIIDLKENKGQGHARNLALQKAKGEYILFLDPDDYFSKDAFEKLFAIIEKKPKTDVFLWGFFLFRDGKKAHKKGLPLKPKKIKGETPFKLGMLNRKGFVGYPWAYVTKKAFLKKHIIRFSEGIFFEDIEFSTSVLFHAKKVTVLPFVGYHYRRHPLSVTGRSSKQKIDDKFTAFTQIKPFLEDKGVFHQYQPLYLARFLAFCVFTSFIDYFSLSKNERDQELDQYMQRIRKSKLLKKENLLLLRNIGLSLPKETEKITRSAFLNAYLGLSGIKKRYWLQSNLMRFFIRINQLKN